MRGRPAQQNHPWVIYIYLYISLIYIQYIFDDYVSLLTASTHIACYCYLFVALSLFWKNSQSFKTAQLSFAVSLQDQVLKKRRKRKEKKKKKSPVARVKVKKRKGRKNLFQAPEDLDTAQVKRLNLCPSTLSRHDEVLLFQRTLVRMSRQKTTLKRKEKMEITYLQVSEQHTISHLKTEDKGASLTN